MIMNYFFTPFFFLFLSATSFSQSFTLKVKLKDISTPSKIILTVKAPGEWKEYTTESGNGQFELKGPLPEPSFAYLVMKHVSALDKMPEAENILEIFLDNEPIVVEGIVSLRSSTIKAGRHQQELSMLKASLRAISPGLRQERQKVVIDFVKSHLDSYVSVYALHDFNLDGSFRVEADKISPLFESLSKAIKESSAGKELAQDIELSRRTALGAMAPDFSQADTTHQQVQLSSFRGKYVLLDFWASWCKPCRAEHPALVKAYHSYKDKGFTIVGISLDNNRNNWLRAIQKDKLGWTHVSDLKFWKNEVAHLYGVKSIPQNLIIDPQGKILAKNIPVHELHSWLEQNIR
jgi:peroxiredoxin